MATQRRKVIPEEAVPEVGSRTVSIDEREYLISNDAMFTLYQRSKGEFSPYFLALRDEKKVLGCRCTRCRLVRVPPFLTHCPDCDFAPTELVEVGQVGVMNSTPPITYFATSLFQHMAPFGRGRVVLEGADTALSVNVYTTTGILVPGLVKKGTQVKVVFRDDRTGEATDIFCVPAAELSPAQVAKHGLQESEINWEAAVEPELPKRTREHVAIFNQAVREMEAIVQEMNRTERAKRDIAGWKRDIQVKAPGGQFALVIHDGDIRLERREVPSPDFVMVCEDPRVLASGLAYRGAITDAVILKKLWISKNAEFVTIFKLDRMARSLARAKKR
ncbi:MAG: hypothetical protein HY535_04545 [Chloroflexi bacterium]|nr:hypothetical protein [Chloroflexota bacterium]